MDLTAIVAIFLPIVCLVASRKIYARSKKSDE